MKRLTSKRVFLSIILAVFTVGSLASLVSISQPATVSALTSAETYECYTTFNGKETNYNFLTSDQQTLYNKCQDAGVCVDAGIGTNDINSRKNTCSDTKNNSIPDSVTTASTNAKLAPVVKVFCGTAPVGEAAQAVFLSCKSKVEANYTSCNTTGGGVTGAMELSNADLATCLKKKIGGSATAKEITDAVAKGRIDGAKPIDAEIQKQVEARAAEEKCAAAGGTVANGVCSVKQTCRGGGLGWLFCPLTEALVGAITGVAGLVEQLLVVKPLLIGDGANGDAIYSIWKVVVGLANLALVAAFLVVIFSQATSVGLSAYGIKKMLPRIIAAAILINLSYFICAIAVDVANILGGTVQGIITAASSVIPNANLGGAHPMAKLLDAVLALSTVGVLAYTGAIFYILPLIASAAMAVLTALFVLAARQILITMLIIMAPLAFAAFVLPNTESLFKKWGKLFMVLLIMYPLIMAIFYGSMLMSQLISTTTPSGAELSTNTILADVMSLLVLVVPLFALPTLMKLAGGILERFGGIVNDRSKGLVDRSKNWAKGRQGERKQYNLDNKINRIGKRNPNNPLRKFSPTANRINRLERNRQANEASKLGAARMAAQHSSTSTDPMVQARAQQALDELDEKEATIKLKFKYGGDAQAAIDEAISTKDNTLLNLSSRTLVDNGQLDKLYQKMETGMSGEQVQSVSKHLLNNSYMPKLKAQDQSMKYLLPDLANGTAVQVDGSGDAVIDPATGQPVKITYSGKQLVQDVFAGRNKHYDTKAMGSSNQSLIDQEQFSLERQVRFGTLDVARSAQIKVDPTLENFKKDRRDILP